MYPYRNPLFGPVDMAFRIYALLLLIRIISSWVPLDRRSKGFYYLYKATEPFLEPFRRMLPATGGIDFSPILAFMVLEIVQELVLRLLM